MRLKTEQFLADCWRWLCTQDHHGDAQEANHEAQIRTTQHRIQTASPAAQTIASEGFLCMNLTSISAE